MDARFKRFLLTAVLVMLRHSRFSLLLSWTSANTSSCRLPPAIFASYPKFFGSLTRSVCRLNTFLPVSGLTAILDRYCSCLVELVLFFLHIWRCDSWWCWRDPLLRNDSVLLYAWMSFFHALAWWQLHETAYGNVYSNSVTTKSLNISHCACLFQLL